MNTFSNVARDMSSRAGTLIIKYHRTSTSLALTWRSGERLFMALGAQYRDLMIVDRVMG